VPLTKPARRNTAAMETMRIGSDIGLDMMCTLTGSGKLHNLEKTELAFGFGEGRVKVPGHAF